MSIYISACVCVCLSVSVYLKCSWTIISLKAGDSSHLFLTQQLCIREILAASNHSVLKQNKIPKDHLLSLITWSLEEG